MYNEEMDNKRNQAIKEANGVYNQIIDDQTNLVNSQSQQIDSYLKNSESALNQSINNNVSALNNATETARRQHEAEKQSVMNNYQNNANNVDETVRVGLLNSARNRISTSEASLNDVIQEYNNQIAQAKITGKSIIAQNALEMLKQKLNLQTQGMDSVNNALIGGVNNTQQLTKDYAGLDRQYSGVRNDYLDRQQEYNQFNKEMAYKNSQLNQQKKLKEQEYQLDLRDAKNSYYRRKSSGSSGGYAITNTSNNNVITGGNTASVKGNAAAGIGIGALMSNGTKYYANYTPTGLTKEGKLVYGQLTKSVLNNRYVTGSQLTSSVLKLPKSQQGIILNAFKRGTSNTKRK